MSHSAHSVSDHYLHPSKDLTPQVDEWSIHTGMTGMIYIVGPGPKAMKRAYREATPERMTICVRAVIVLNTTRREDVSAGPEEILAALLSCGWEDDC